MKKWILGLVALAGLSSAHAEMKPSQYHLMDLNFGAPVVSGDPTAGDSKVGSIVYDLSTHTFRGLFDDGTWSSIATGASLPIAPTIQKITSGSGTYNTPTGVLYIRIRMVGAGGAGGGAIATAAGQTAAGGGGGGGGYVEALLTSPAATYSYSIGAGGLGVSGGNGNAGGSTTFGTFIAAGGSGANAGNPSAATTLGGNGGVGGSATGGDLNIPGGAGLGAVYQGNVQASASGAGGSSFLGTGGRQSVITGPGGAGNNFGSGGGGASISQSTGNTAGGSGAPGYIEVTEYYQ